MSVTLTPFYDAPCPRVEVFLDDLPVGAASVTVYRLAGGRQFPVRGAVGAAVAGSLARVDFEVPFNVEVTYRAEVFDAAGLSLGFTDTASVTLAVAGSWMHNPLDPRGAVRVRLAESAARSLSRPVPGEVSHPRGRRVGVVLAEPRQGLRGVVLDVVAESLVDADRVQGLLGGYTLDQTPVVCVRDGSDDPVRVAKPLFLGVLDVVEEDWTVRFGGEVTVQRIVGDEVAPPAPGLFIPLLRAADVNAFYATAAAANAAYLTASDLNRDYSLAGYADA